MLMLVECGLEQDAIEWPASGSNSHAMVVAAEPPSGDTMHFGPDRLAVEIVFGFRPGQDRIVIVASRSPRAARVLATEEAGNAVVVDGERRRIVLAGVRLADLQRGDIELGDEA